MIHDDNMDDNDDDRNMDDKDNDNNLMIMMRLIYG